MSTDIPRDGTERFRAAGPESYSHLWPKLELYRRKERRETPCFEGTYRFEKRVADRAPDVFVLRESPGLHRWIEFVAGSAQAFRRKTREALRLGFRIHWVVHADHHEQVTDARAALSPDLDDGVTLGTYDPQEDRLELGDGIDFSNYAFPVEGMDEFRPDAILGYRAGAASIGRTDGWYDLGEFSFDGRRRRILVLTPQGRGIRAVPPDRELEAGSVESISEAVAGPELADRIAAGAVTRLGPVKRQARER